MPIVMTDAYSQAPILAKFEFQGQELASATAFMYRKDNFLYLVSNWHNLSGRNPQTRAPLSDHCGIPDAVSCYLTLNGEYIARTWHRFPLVNAQTCNWLEHPEFGSAVDVGILPIELPDTYRAIPINDLPSTQMTVRVSQDVFVLGYPLGLTQIQGLPIWKRASVATEPGTSERFFLVDSATRKGMSGSPVILRYRGFYANDPSSGTLAPEDWFGEGDLFVGVYSGRLGPTELEAQLGIVWKASVVDEIIAGRVFARCD